MHKGIDLGLNWKQPLTKGDKNTICYFLYSGSFWYVFGNHTKSDMPSQTPTKVILHMLQTVS